MSYVKANKQDSGEQWEGFKDSAGKLYDETLGRSGLFGWLADKLGAEGADEADARRIALREADAWTDKTVKYRDSILPNVANKFNFDQIGEGNKFSGLLGNINSGNLANDNSARLREQSLISNTINRKSAQFNNEILNANEKLSSANEMVYRAREKQDLYETPNIEG